MYVQQGQGFAPGTSYGHMSDYMGQSHGGFAPPPPTTPFPAPGSMMMSAAAAPPAPPAGPPIGPPNNGIGSVGWAANAFFFQRRRGRINWRALSHVDIDRLMREVDVDTLQDNLEHITFADIESEDTRYMTDRDFVKLFRIAQLMIEYLLHAQDYLAVRAQTLENEYKRAAQEIESEKKKGTRQQQEIDLLKKELKQKRRTLATYEFMLTTMPANQAAGRMSNFKCTLCEKVFQTQDFLGAHMQRRHGVHGIPESGLAGPRPLSPGMVGVNPDTYATQEAERLRVLEEKLKMDLEKKLEREKDELKKKEDELQKASQQQKMKIQADLIALQNSIRTSLMAQQEAFTGNFQPTQPMPMPGAPGGPRVAFGGSAPAQRGGNAANARSNAGMIMDDDSDVDVRASRASFAKAHNVRHSKSMSPTRDARMSPQRKVQHEMLSSIEGSVRGKHGNVKSIADARLRRENDLLMQQIEELQARDRSTRRKAHRMIEAEHMSMEDELHDKLRREKLEKRQLRDELERVKDNKGVPTTILTEGEAQKTLNELSAKIAQQEAELKKQRAEHEKDKERIKDELAKQYNRTSKVEREAIELEYDERSKRQLKALTQREEAINELKRARTNTEQAVELVQLRRDELRKHGHDTGKEMIVEVLDPSRVLKEDDRASVVTASDSDISNDSNGGDTDRELMGERIPFSTRPLSNAYARSRFEHASEDMAKKMNETESMLKRQLEQKLSQLHPGLKKDLDRNHGLPTDVATNILRDIKKDKEMLKRDQSQARKNVHKVINRTTRRHFSEVDGIQKEPEKDKALKDSSRMLANFVGKLGSKGTDKPVDEFERARRLRKHRGDVSSDSDDSYYTNSASDDSRDRRIAKAKAGKFHQNQREYVNDFLRGDKNLRSAPRGRAMYGSDTEDDDTSVDTPPSTPRKGKGKGKGRGFDPSDSEDDKDKNMVEKKKSGSRAVSDDDDDGAGVVRKHKVKEPEQSAGKVEGTEAAKDKPEPIVKTAEPAAKKSNVEEDKMKEPTPSPDPEPPKPSSKDTKDSNADMLQSIESFDDSEGSPLKMPKASKPSVGDDDVPEEKA